MKEHDRTRAKGALWWAKRILGGLLVLFLVLILSGALYQAIAASSDRTRLPPPGDLVDVGGRRLHISCVGTGSPTVILEAGLGDNWLTWSLVQEQIGDLTQVCAYDRAGLGWSDPAPGPLTSAQVAESLHTLLHNAGIPGPYVLVGHSIGGLYVRSFAHQYPAEVVGLVLVDSSHENQMVRFPAEIVRIEKESLSGLIRSLTLCRTIAPFGLVRMLKLTEASIQNESLSPEQRQMLVTTVNRTGYCQAVRNEIVTALEVDTNQNDPPDNLGSIPLAVLTVPVDPSTRNTADLPAGSVELYEQADRTRIELQQELVGLSSNSTHVIAQESGHYIQFDRPELVMEAVRQVVEAARQ